MTATRKHWLRRSAVGLGAALALFVVTASPAAADGLPDDIDVELEVVGGLIDINGNEFPLGGEPDPEDDCATGNPSTISATVGPETSNLADVTVTSSNFQPTEVAEVFGTPICATIVIDNTPAGVQEQTGTGTGTIDIDDPGALIDVQFSVGCVLQDIDVDLSGSITGTAGPWDATLGSSGFFVDDVNSGGSCSFFEAAAINSALDVPTSNTDATFVIEVTEV